MIRAHTPPFDTVEDIGFPAVEESAIQYRFREDELIREFQAYIDKTYSQHYVNGGKQTIGSIIEKGHGTGFCMGNVEKYSDRYGKKGETPAEWRKDLTKILHYTLFQLYIHDLTYGNQ